VREFLWRRLKAKLNFNLFNHFNVMALYGNQKNNGAEDQVGWQEFTNPCVAPAKIDEMLLDAIEALEQARRLHASTPNPETKRQTKRILDSLHSSLLKLAPLGVHSVGRLESMTVAR
jgi:hypothetical protein